MRKDAAERAPEAISECKRNSGAMAQSALPITEVLVVADTWDNEPDAESAIQRAIALAAEMVDADTGGAELAVVVTGDTRLPNPYNKLRGIGKPTHGRFLSPPQPPRDTPARG